MKPTVEKMARALFGKCLLTLNHEEQKQLQDFYFTNCVQCVGAACKTCEKLGKKK
jgi:hypothetical protein